VVGPDSGAVFAVALIAAAVLAGRVAAP
jgi:hypothetical protein